MVIDFEMLAGDQTKVMQAGKDEIEYVFIHHGKYSSYYNVYPSYVRVLLEAIKPRYWRGSRNVILIRLKAVKVDPSRFDSYT